MDRPSLPPSPGRRGAGDDGRRGGTAVFDSVLRSKFERYQGVPVSRTCGPEDFTPSRRTLHRVRHEHLGDARAKDASLSPASSRATRESHDSQCLASRVLGGNAPRHVIELFSLSFSLSPSL